MSTTEASKGKSGAPTEPEIKEQLARIVGSETFLGKEGEAKLLKYLVNALIKRKKVTEQDIRQDLYGSAAYSAKTTMPRVTATELRKSLGQYDGGPGSNDPVNLSMPKPKKAGRAPTGEAYKVIAIHNPRNPTNRIYATALSYSTMRKTVDVMTAGSHFSKVLEANPNHAGAIVGRFENLMKYKLIAGDEHIAVETFIDPLRNAVRLDAENWWPRVVLAAALLLSKNVGQADAEFKRALALDGASVRSYGWFHLFLLATREIAEAENILKDAVESNPVNIWASVCYWATAYFRDDHDAARERLVNCFQIDGDLWIFPFIGSLFLLEENASREVCVHELDRAEKLFWASENEYFAGVRALIAGMVPDNETNGAIKIAKEGAERRQQWFDVALCGIAVRDFEAAREGLETAWLARDPRMLLMHRWPFLRPVHHFDWFKSLASKRLSKPYTASVADVRSDGKSLG